MMHKRLTALLLLCVLLLPATPAYAVNGFSDIGGYTETDNEYTFLTQDAVMVYNKTVVDPSEYEEAVYAGSDLYIPLAVWTEDSGEEKLATDKQVKNDNIEVSYKVMRGGDYIDGVSIVNPKKLKLEELPAGAYVQVQFADVYPLVQKTHLAVRLVLSANGVSFQDTRVTFECNLMNRTETIDRNSVYGAKVPTQFKTSVRYRGEATFDFGDNIRYTAKVKANSKYYLNLDRTGNKAISDMYTQPYLEFYNFKGNLDTFASVGKLEIPITRTKFKTRNGAPQLYAYEIKGDKLQALRKGDATFNPRTNKLTILTKTLGEYVLSSQALLPNVENIEDNIFKAGYAETLEEVNSVPEESSRSSRRS